MTNNKIPISKILFDSTPYTNLSITVNRINKEERVISFCEDIVSQLPKVSLSNELVREVEINPDFSDLRFPDDRDLIYAIIVRFLQGIEPYKSKLNILSDLFKTIFDWDTLYRVIMFADEHSQSLTHWSELRRDLAWSILEKSAIKLKSLADNERTKSFSALLNLVKVLTMNPFDGCPSNIDSANKIIDALGFSNQNILHLGEFVKWLSEDYLELVLTSDVISEEMSELISISLKNLTQTLRFQASLPESIWISVALKFSSYKVRKIGSDNLKNSLKAIGRELLAFQTEESLKSYWQCMPKDEQVKSRVEILTSLAYCENYQYEDFVYDQLISLPEEITRYTDISTYAYGIKGKDAKYRLSRRNETLDSISNRIQDDRLYEKFCEIIGTAPKKKGKKRKRNRTVIPTDNDDDIKSR